MGKVELGLYTTHSTGVPFPYSSFVYFLLFPHLGFDITMAVPNQYILLSSAPYNNSKQSKMSSSFQIWLLTPRRSYLFASYKQTFKFGRLCEYEI